MKLLKVNVLVPYLVRDQGSEGRDRSSKNLRDENGARTEIRAGRGRKKGSNEDKIGMG